MEKSLDQVIFFTGLILFIIALFLFGFMLVEYFKEKEKLLRKVHADADVEFDPDGQSETGAIEEEPEDEYSIQERVARDRDAEVALNRVESASRRASLQTTLTDHPPSGIFAITSLCGRPRPNEDEGTIRAMTVTPMARWSREVKELCSYTQPVDDLPPSYSESFRYPPVPMTPVYASIHRHP